MIMADQSGDVGDHNATQGSTGMDPSLHDHAHGSNEAMNLQDPRQHQVDGPNMQMMNHAMMNTQPTFPLKARLQCYACNKLLEYDSGAQYVQCFSCSTMNAAQQGSQAGGRVLSMLCPICHTTNLAPYGVNYVRCGTCHTISQVTHAYNS